MIQAGVKEWHGVYILGFILDIRDQRWRKSDIQEHKKDMMHYCWHQGGEGHTARNVGSLSTPRVAPGWLITARKWGHQSYNHNELNSTNNLNELRSRLFPRACRQELTLGNTSDTEPSDSLSREASLDWWPTELGANKWMFLTAKFTAMCYAAKENQCMQKRDEITWPVF